MNKKKRKLKSGDGEVFEIEEDCLKLSKYFTNISNAYPNPNKEKLNLVKLSKTSPKKTPKRATSIYQ